MTDTAQACIWVYDDIDNFYTAGCGKTFCFTDEGVKGNSFLYCPYCGKKINEVKHGPSNRHGAAEGGSRADV